MWIEGNLCQYTYILNRMTLFAKNKLNLNKKQYR